MSNVKALTTIAITTLFAVPAFAQNADQGSNFEASPELDMMESEGEDSVVPEN